MPVVWWMSWQIKNIVASLPIPRCFYAFSVNVGHGMVIYQLAHEPTYPHLGILLWPTFSFSQYRVKRKTFSYPPGCPWSKISVFNCVFLWLCVYEFDLRWANNEDLMTTSNYSGAWQSQYSYQYIVVNSHTAQITVEFTATSRFVSDYPHLMGPH